LVHDNNAVRDQNDAQTVGQSVNASSWGFAIMHEGGQAQTKGIAQMQLEASHQLADFQRLHTRYLREQLGAALRNVARVNSTATAKSHVIAGRMMQIVEESSDDENHATPIPSQRASSRSLAASSSSSSSTRLAGTPITTASSNFNLTLCRMHDKPFGLEVQPDFIQQCLAVEGVCKGSVCEAWNQQNIGELREIRIGDRIVAVNGYHRVEAMRNEFYGRLTVCMMLEREASTNLPPE